MHARRAATTPPATAARERTSGAAAAIQRRTSNAASSATARISGTRSRMCLPAEIESRTSGSRSHAAANRSTDVAAEGRRTMRTTANSAGTLQGASFGRNCIA